MFYYCMKIAWFRSGSVRVDLVASANAATAIIIVLIVFIILYCIPLHMTAD